MSVNSPMVLSINRTQVTVCIVTKIGISTDYVKRISEFKQDMLCSNILLPCFPLPVTLVFVLCLFFCSFPSFLFGFMESSICN